MAAAVQICTVCEHDYDSADKKPLVLSCGHSFCKDCFRKMESSGNRLCPVCRSDWSSRDVDSLPVCYQLLPPQGHTDPFRCEEHNNHMTIWCTTCERRCCLICLYMNHQGCSWKPVQTEIGELQGKIEEIQMRAEQILSKNKDKLRASRETVNVDLKAFRFLKLKMTETEKSLENEHLRLNIIEAEILQSTANLTATNVPAGQDLLQSLKDKVSALQEFKFDEPDWPSPSIPVGMANVLEWYRKRKHVTSESSPNKHRRL